MPPTNLDPIWHLRHLDRDDDAWEFTTNFKLDLDNSTLRSRLQGETREPLRISDTELAVQVGVLVRELRGRAGGTRTLSEGALSLKLSPRLDHVIRKPTQAGWEDRLAFDGYLYDAKGHAVQQFAESVQLADLTAAARRGVWLLDLRSLRLCHGIYADNVRNLDGYPVEQLPPIRRVSVFIAYRRTHSEAAQALHDVLSNMGGGLHFEPYIDRHDVTSGKWKSQLMSRIARVDIFMPLVSPDYADNGTVGLEEYHRALEVAEERSISDFFAPVFLGTPGTDPGQSLREFDGFEVADGTKISPDDKDLEAWLGRVLVAGLGRPASGA